MSNPEVHIFDNGGASADRYTVIINLTADGRPDWHYWGMSDDALMPNGVCMYGGILTEAEVSDYFKARPVITWPPQVKTQVERIVADS